MEETKEKNSLGPSGFILKTKHKNDQLQARANSIKQKIAREFDNPQKHIHESQDSVERILKSLESTRRTTETWIYIDMDMFYASIEIRDNPSLCDKPIAVTNGSIISTANYIARRFGVKSSMPEFQAEKLCPDLILILSNLEKYKVENENIKAIFREYDENFEELGLDEAGLHVSNVLRRRCSDTDAGRQALANEIRQKIFVKTQLTSSAGIACNKMLAKLCSKVNKPNGQFYLKPENVKEYIKNVDVAAVSGISKQEAKLLKLLGVQTCGDIIKKKLELYFGLSELLLTNVFKCALGLGPTEHMDGRGPGKKSFSASKTFDTTDDQAFVESKLTELTDQLDLEMRKNKVKAKGIEVSIKNYSYEIRTRREVTKSYFSTGDELLELSLTLLRMFYPLEPIRNLMIKIWNLKVGPTKSVQKKQVQKPNKYASSEFESLFMNKSITPDKKNVSASANQGLKIIRFECENCGKWLTGTDTQMNFHLQVCTGYLKQNK